MALFDTGVTHSFTSQKFASTHKILIQLLGTTYWVDVPEQDYHNREISILPYTNG